MGKKIGMTLTALAMLVLILDAKTAQSGALAGIGLCIRSVIPSLFPLFVLSGLLTSGLSGSRLRLLRPVCRLVGIPEGGETLLAVGFLGGYPMGAQCVSQLYQQRQISEKCAKRLLMFCSNAGPAFLFGIAAPQFSSPWAGWALLGIQLLSALLVGLLLPGKEAEPVKPPETSASLPEAVNRSVAVMARICGWVVLFRILLAFLEAWLPISGTAGVVISGLLELTVGCCNLQKIPQEGLRFVAAAGLLSFGGLCVWLQTASVTGPLGTKSYILGKLLQMFLAVALALLLVNPTGQIPVVMALAAILLREAKKRGGNMASVGV